MDHNPHEPNLAERLDQGGRTLMKVGAALTAIVWGTFCLAFIALVAYAAIATVMA